METTRVGGLLGAGLLLAVAACTHTPAPQGGGEPSTRQPAAAAGSTGATGSSAPATRGGGMVGGRGMMGGGMTGGMMGRRADTAAAPTAAAAKASAPGCPDVSQALVDEGRKVFTGQGGTCFACHGSDGRGTALAPNLTDTSWLDIDGSYAAIDSLVHAGVAHPTQFPAPMPPMGGASLSAAQVCSVAAYVYSLSH